MKYIRKFDNYKDYKINEEFIGKLIKGALSKMFQAFSLPFKDLAEDIKKGFKESDPNSIKNVIMTNLNSAMDGVKKSIRNLKPPVNGQNSDIEDIMNQFITSLSELSKNMEKDFSTAIKDRTKAFGASDVAKAILVGVEGSDWKGIIGLLNNPEYKYSKPKYEKAIADAAQKKTGNDAFKAKKDAASRFFDQMEQDISLAINKNLSEEELVKLYNDGVKKAGGKSGYTYNQLKEFFDKGVEVLYKRKGYDDEKKPEDQVGLVGKKKISNLEEDGVVFKSEDGDEFKKKYSDILGPSKKEEGENKDINSELTNNLKELSQKDEKNIEVLKKVTDEIKKDPNYLNKLEQSLPKNNNTNGQG